MNGRIISIAAVVLLSMAPLAPAQVKVGDKPSLTFKAAGTNNTVSLSDYAGKIVVIDFWATWCGPCMGQAQHMVDLNAKFADQGVVLIGISLDNDATQMAQVAAAKGFTWVQCCDGMGWNSPVAQQFGVDGIPHTFVLSTDGTVLWSNHPAAGLDEAIEAALKAYPPVLVDPKTSADVSADLDAVDKALSADDFSSAAKAWAALPAGIDKDRKLAARHADIQKKLDAACAKVLADVQTMVRNKQYREAIAALKDIQSKLATLPAAATAHDYLLALNSDPAVKKEIAAADRLDRAAAALAVANALKDQKKDEQAYLHLKAVVSGFAGTPAADTAADELAAYDKQYPDLAQRAAGSANDAKAKALFGLAEAYRNAENLELARKKYQEVIDKYPTTTWADAARKQLGSL